MSFFAELKRRNVIRMAGLYLVGAWLVTQVVGTVLPMFGAPEWIARSVVILLAIGFIPALIVAWIFELTPEGLKRDDEVPKEQSIAPKTARRMDRGLLLISLLALGYFAVDKFLLAPGRVAEPAAAASEAASGGAAPTTLSATATDPLAKPIVPGIAVLPFDNLSPDPDNAFFAGGIFEEVLTKLSRMSELRIISRTSMESIAKEDLEVSAIGRRLGVSHVLEGSVRKAGDQIRVTVQLIEAATDAHIWAENYDRKLDDVFAIQSEIALAIADQLKLSLSGELQASLKERPTQNQEAYALYLRALDTSRSWRGESDFRTLITLLEPALQLDPDFLAAKLLLVEAYGRMPWLVADPDGSFAAKARQLTDEITQRWPERPEAQLAQALIHYTIEQDYARALTAFQAMQARLSNHPMVSRGISVSLKRLGRYEEFLRAARAALAADPESPLAHGEVYLALEYTRRYDEALAFAERSKQKFPEDLSTVALLARIKLLRNQDLDAYLDFGKRAGVAIFAEDRRRLPVGHFVRGDIDAALALLKAEGQAAEPRNAAWIDSMRAELLRLAGRASEADLLAREAFAVVRDSTDVEQPRADIGAAIWYARAAQIAAIAGERATAMRWRDQAMASPPQSIDRRAAVARALSAAARALGDQEAAWQLLAPFAGEASVLPDAELRVFKPYYDRLYGESASYRAYMVKIAAGPTPTP